MCVLRLLLCSIERGTLNRAWQQKYHSSTIAGYTISMSLILKRLQDNNRNGIKYIDEKQRKLFNSPLGRLITLSCPQHNGGLRRRFRNNLPGLAVAEKKFFALFFQ